MDELSSVKFALARAIDTVVYNACLFDEQSDLFKRRMDQYEEDEYCSIVPRRHDTAEFMVLMQQVPRDATIRSQEPLLRFAHAVDACNASTEELAVAANELARALEIPSTFQAEHGEVPVTISEIMKAREPASNEAIASLAQQLKVRGLN